MDSSTLDVKVASARSLDLEAIALSRQAVFAFQNNDTKCFRVLISKLNYRWRNKMISPSVWTKIKNSF